MGRSRSRSRSPRRDRERAMGRTARSRSRERERRRERPVERAPRDPHRERADRERERVEREQRPLGRERGRDRSPSPGAGGRWPRGRSPPGRRRSMSRSPSPEPVMIKRGMRKETSERKEIDESQLVGKTEEEIEMMKQMGFCNFDTTKDRAVELDALSDSDAKMATVGGGRGSSDMVNGTETRTVKIETTHADSEIRTVKVENDDIKSEVGVKSKFKKEKKKDAGSSSMSDRAGQKENLPLDGNSDKCQAADEADIKPDTVFLASIPLPPPKTTGSSAFIPRAVTRNVTISSNSRPALHGADSPHRPALEVQIRRERSSSPVPSVKDSSPGPIEQPSPSLQRTVMKTSEPVTPTPNSQNTPKTSRSPCYPPSGDTGHRRRSSPSPQYYSPRTPQGQNHNEYLHTPHRFNQPSYCVLCFQEGHAMRGCRNPRRCRVCRVLGHHAGSQRCEDYTEDPLIMPFQGAGDILSNFYPCHIHLYAQKFHSSEQAYQYKKAVEWGLPYVVKQIMAAETARDVKLLASRALKGPPGNHDQFKMDVMREVLEAKAADCKDYRHLLLSADPDTKFGEATTDLFWATGLNREQTRHTRADRWPGKNTLGQFHKELAEKLRAECAKQNEECSSPIPDLVRCLVCGDVGHCAASTDCAYYTDGPLIVPYLGPGDILSNFYPCIIHLYGQKFHSSEQAYQYKKAIDSGLTQVAEQVMAAETARDVKSLCKNMLKGQSGDHKQFKLGVMKSVIEAKAAQCDEYRRLLLDADPGSVFGEATSDLFWGTGLNRIETKNTLTEHWPGKNRMGQLHMEIADKLRTEHGKKQQQSDAVCCRVCHVLGHSAGSSECADYTEDPLIVPFHGAGDILSNFYPCRLRLFGQNFHSSEQAYQYKKATEWGLTDVAEQIMAAETARDVKILCNEALKGPPGDHEQFKLDLMKEVLAAKAVQCGDYRLLLMDADPDTKFGEATTDLFWATGLNREETRNTRADRWPGKNVMGQFHKDMAAKVKVAYRNYKQQRSGSASDSKRTAETTCTDDSSPDSTDSSDEGGKHSRHTHKDSRRRRSKEPHQHGGKKRRRDDSTSTDSDRDGSKDRNHSRRRKTAASRRSSSSDSDSRRRQKRRESHSGSVSHKKKEKRSCVTSKSSVSKKKHASNIRD